jgi:hypothetical protein
MATIAMENLRPLPECRAYLGRFRELINDTKLTGPAFEAARRALWLEARPCFMPSPPKQAAVRPPQAIPIKATPAADIAGSAAKGPPSPPYPSTGGTAVSVNAVAPPKVTAEAKLVVAGNTLEALLPERPISEVTDAGAAFAGPTSELPAIATGATASATMPAATTTSPVPAMRELRHPLRLVTLRQDLAEQVVASTPPARESSADGSSDERVLWAQAFAALVALNLLAVAAVVGLRRWRARRAAPPPAVEDDPRHALPSSRQGDGPRQGSAASSVDPHGRAARSYA